MEQVLRLYSERDILEHLGIPIDVLFCNPFRNDQNPSCTCSLFRGRYVFKDWSQNVYFTFESAACFLFNYAKYPERPNDKAVSLALKGILEIMRARNVKTIENNPQKIIKKESTIIAVKQRKWEKYDVSYFSPISLKLLSKYQCCALHSAMINDRITHYNTPNSPLYAYYRNGYWKLYKPFEKYLKWRTNMPASLLLGDENPTHLCTSLKDGFSLHTILGVSFGSFQSESYIPRSIPESVKYLVIDNDNAGETFGEKMREKFNLSIIRPIKKDVFEDIKNFTLDNLIQHYECQS